MYRPAIEARSEAQFEVTWRVYNAQTFTRSFIFLVGGIEADCSRSFLKRNTLDHTAPSLPGVENLTQRLFKRSPEILTRFLFIGVSLRRLCC